jgi:hypothetical protein
MPVTTDHKQTASEHCEDDHEDSHHADKVEYIRLALMALVIVASITGWWKAWMSRDWLAFAATLIAECRSSRRLGKTSASGA